MNDIPGYEGRYAVTEDGKVWSHLSKRFLTVKLGRSGYAQINLCVNGKGINAYIHRLVALTYLPNPESLSQVNHKDGDRMNASVSNLEWCNQSQNIKHSYEVLGQVPPWRGKKRPEIKQWFTPYQPGNLPWNKGKKVGSYIPRKRMIVSEPLCPLCKVRNRWVQGTYPDGLKRYNSACNKCLAEAIHGKEDNVL